MMISVTERTREIGVRKALGARRREILWQFLVEAATLTLAGGVCGMIAGGVVALLIAAATPVRAHVPMGSIVAALAAAAVPGILFGIYPAIRAARLDPAEALRDEQDLARRHALPRNHPPRLPDPPGAAAEERLLH